MDTLRSVFWVTVIGVVACFAFFFVLGAITTDAIGLILVVCGLAVLWLVHAWRQSRQARDGRDPALTHARERRGF